MVLSPLLLQTVVNSPQYPTFLADAMKVFLKILEDGEPQFIAEQNMQVSLCVCVCVCVCVKSEAPLNILVVTGEPSRIKFHLKSEPTEHLIYSFS